MKNWYTFYQDNIINWDMLLKLPSVVILKKNYSKASLVKNFTCVSKANLIIKLQINNETDFKIIKAIRFFKDFFKNSLIGVKLIDKRNKSSSKVKVDKLILVSVSCISNSLIYLLEKFIRVMLINVIKKQIPIDFGIDTNGIVRVILKDIGELGIAHMKYDYFGWNNDLVVELYNKHSIIYSNLLISYLNFKFIV